MAPDWQDSSGTYLCVLIQWCKSTECSDVFFQMAFRVTHAFYTFMHAILLVLFQDKVLPHVVTLEPNVK